MLLDFKEIPQANTGNGDQDTFELFSRDFLECAGYKIIEEPNRGPDGKKDMIVEEVLMGVDTSTSIRWLVSCKHYAHSGKAVSDSDEINITERLTQHNCGGFMGVYSTVPTSGLSDLLQGASYKHRTFDHEQIEKKIIELKEKGWILTQRYFPKSAKQIRPHDLGINEPKQSWEKMDDQLKKTLLSCAILYRSNHNSSISHQRDALLQQTILAILKNQKGASVAQIVKVFHDSFHRDIDSAQIDDLLQNMQQQDVPKVFENNGVWGITRVVNDELENFQISTNNNLNELINDVLQKIKENYGNYDYKIELLLKQNITNVLNAFFRLYGSEILFNSTKVRGDFQKREIIKGLASKGLKTNPSLVTSMLYSIGLILETPTIQQKNVLETYVDAYVIAEIMQVDPALNDCKKELFKNKIFFLDTDFVLHSIVKESPLHTKYYQMVEKLISIGCRVVISPQVSDEVLSHARGAIQNYKDNKALYDVRDRAVLYDDYHNVFVDGFLVAHDEDNTLTINQYMDNYISKRSKNLIYKVFEASFPKGILYGDNIDVISNVTIPQFELNRLRDEIFQCMQKEPRGEKRDDSSNNYLSTNDAQLYLTAYHLAGGESNEDFSNVLENECYIVTTSTRTIRCAYKLKYYKDIVTRPIFLERVLQEVASFDEDCESLDLLGNPFLSLVAYNNKEVLTKLAYLGVDLRHKNIPRLLEDLESVLRDDLTKDVTNELLNIESIPDTPMDNLQMYSKMAQKVKNAGYSLMPDATVIVETLRNQEKDNEQQAKEIAQLKQKRQKKDRNQLRYEQSLSTKKSLSKKEIKNKL